MFYLPVCAFSLGFLGVEMKRPGKTHLSYSILFKSTVLFLFVSLITLILGENKTLFVEFSRGHNQQRGDMSE